MRHRNRHPRRTVRALAAVVAVAACGTAVALAAPGGPGRTVGDDGHTVGVREGGGRAPAGGPPPVPTIRP